MSREIVLDTETTGLDPRSGHRVVEIGAVELVNTLPTGKTFHEYLNPERDMPAEAEAVHGLSAAFLEDKPLFSQVAERFVDFIGGARLVIHNAGFDVAFLNAELARLGREPIGMERVVDTLIIAKRKYPGAQASLDALCKRHGVDLGGRSKHGALLDAELLAQVYRAMLGGEQAGLDLTSRAGSGGNSHDAGRSGSHPERPRPLAPRLTQEEIAAHEAFIAGIKGALWHSGSSGGSG